MIFRIWVLLGDWASKFFEIGHSFFLGFRRPNLITGHPIFGFFSDILFLLPFFFGYLTSFPTLSGGLGTMLRMNLGLI